MSNISMEIGDFNPGNVGFYFNGNIVFIDIDAKKKERKFKK